VLYSHRPLSLTTWLHASSSPATTNRHSNGDDDDDNDNDNDDDDDDDDDANADNDGRVVEANSLLLFSKV